MSRAAGPDVHLAAGRHQFIIDELNARGQVQAVALAERLGVTHETVRRDLTLLQERGLLRRVHGGAVLAESLVHEAPVAMRTAYGPEKVRIAQAALAFVPASGAVLLDSGTTTLTLAQALPSVPDLVAVTNSLPIATALLPRVGGLSILGGRVRRETEATVDQWALRSLAALRVDVAFLGTNAFSIEHGLATPDEAEAAIKAAFVTSARLRVLLADHSKFGRESLHRYARMDDIDVLITSRDLPEADAAELARSSGVEVIRA